MSESLDALEPKSPGEHVVPPGPMPQPEPPIVQIIKTVQGCQVGHNLVDPWLAVALIDMGRDALLEEMKRPRVVRPTNGIAGLLKRMGR